MREPDNPFLVVGHDRLRAGSKAYGRAARLLPFLGRADELHDDLRRSLGLLRGAMNYFEDEDTDAFELAHNRLDAAGRLAREEFPRGCALTQRDGAYLQECPVALAHNRAGLSPGIRIKKMECSICGRDPDDCDHVRGRRYDGHVCGHIITEGDILEVSIVGKPAQPDARLTAITVRTSELHARLGPDFTPGVPVTCDNCLTPCEGIAWPFRDQAPAPIQPS